MNIITRYLPLSKKKLIIEEIVESNIEIVNGMAEIDFIGLELHLTMHLLKFYTDVDLDTTDIDELYANGKIELLKEEIKDDFNMIETLVYKTINQKINNYNSLSGVLNRNIEKLINKIPDEKGLKRVLKEMQKLDLDKIPQVKELYNAVKGGN